MSELGGGLGLRVQFLTTHGPPRVHVVYDGELLGAMPCPGLRSGRLTGVSIAASTAGVSVTYGGNVLFHELAWGTALWAPQPWAWLLGVLRFHLRQPLAR